MNTKLASAQEPVRQRPWAQRLAEISAGAKRPNPTAAQVLPVQQRPWAQRLAEISADGIWEEWPEDEPDFAPVPTDQELLDEIIEAEALKMALESWYLDDDVELDDHGNPIVKSTNWDTECPF